MCTDSMCPIIGYAVDKNQLIKTIPAFYVTRRFIIDFTKVYPEGLRQYSVWLRAGRPGDRGSIPGRGKGFFL
jgi:hypothetical protein